MSDAAPLAGERPGPKALDAALLRIRDARGEPVGLGFLVSPGLALTCAHVVSAALGTPHGAEPPASARLHVDLPLLPGGQRGGSGGVTASVANWVPPQQSGAGDMAVLRLSAPLPGGRPVRLVETQHEDVWDHPVRAFGFPAGRPDGVWHSAVLREGQATGWIQADPASREGYRVTRGFSGSPVWDDRLGGVVGMMVQAEAAEPGVSYLIPTTGLLAAWPGLAELALPPSPFRSLSAFQESDAAVFHGRRPESQALAAELTGRRWITLVGPSGSGKSSLALAGIVPRRRAAGDAVVVLRPDSGRTPLTALAAVLLPLLEPGLSETERLTRLPAVAGALADGGLADIAAALTARDHTRRLLVVVDQFEELLARGPAAVDQLAAVLYHDALPSDVRVLTTLRADFLEAALDHEGLGEVLRSGIHYLAPLGPRQLREAVTAPVAAVPGVRYEADLADRILADTGTGHGALPLLGFTLDQLWQRQNGGLLTHGAYGALGGVTGALSAYAEEVWEAYVPASDAGAARRLFTRLIRVPIGSAAATRRTAARRELGEDEARIAQALAATRLLVAATDAEGTETVELAHEALITGWTRLAGWAAVDRSFLGWRESLRHDMDRWESGGRAPELLPSASALAGARQWLEARGAELTETERDYLERGRTHHRARTRIRRVLVSIGVSSLVLALVFAGMFAYASDQSRKRDALAGSRALAQVAQDEAVNDPVRGVMLAIAAYDTAPTEEARNQLLRQYLTYSDAARVLSGPSGDIAQFDSSRDGEVVFARSTAGRAVIIVHAASGTVRSELLDVKQVVTALVSPDGSRAAFVADNGSGGWFEVHADGDRISGPVHRLPKVAGAQQFGDPARGMAMSADGRRVAVTTENSLVWWDLDTGAQGGSVPLPGRPNGSLWFAPDNRTLLAGLWRGEDIDQGHRLVALDPAGGAPREVVGEAHEFVPSGDRAKVIVCRKQGDGSVFSRLRLSDGAQDGGQYLSKSLCPDGVADETGHRVALKDSDGLALVDLDEQKEIARATARDGTKSVSLHLVAREGRMYLATMGNDTPWITHTRIWPAPQTLSVSQQRLTLDGSRTISVLKGGTALQLRPTAVGDERLLAEAPRPQPYFDPKHTRLELHRGGRLFADRDAKNAVSIREVSTLRQTVRISTAMPQSDDDFGYSFHPDGSLVTYAGTQVQQWDPETGKELAHFDVKDLLSGSGAADKASYVRVTPYPAANQVIVFVSGDPVVRIADVTTGRTVATVPVAEDTIAVQFESSGRFLALMRSGGMIELWRRDPLRRELGPLPSVGDSGDTKYVARFVDSEGRFLVAAHSSIRTFRIGAQDYLDSYDFGQAKGRFGGMDGYEFMDLSQDGKTVIYLDPKRSGGPLRLDPALWQRELCKVIGGREFTAEERRTLPVRVPTRPVCEGR
ncbi:trypsin-like peptidase domain-containing protein [Streptomyces sp. NBC_01443]|uniref:nSTAND1 domain-containing NTPase n=1 Tax=Streptomyces sp. NBC_01443 TaxID=2903868 RepID=UPI0022516F44|nr:trypsin-like peptidase domain-containing protein [Streptomyces sp. NBC_01443]MCX4626901.1 trypsin-like peptidase domain-containing protein [Streptomyces sp. NBC_01443]